MRKSRLTVAAVILAAMAVLAQDPNNVAAPPRLYGTTAQGGAYGQGVVYSVDQSGKETVLYSFTGGPDGGDPIDRVAADSAGNLYGTTYKGGAYNYGVVFKLDPIGKETVLHTFSSGTDGGGPDGGVIRDSAGNLYGTTEFGGVFNSGTVYKVDANGNETVLYSFTGGSDGLTPVGNLVRDSAGNLYGTTRYGGTGGWGTVYKLESSSNLITLYAFTGQTDGGFPTEGVTRDRAGNLYGATTYGGIYGYGTVYKLDSSGNETALYNFTGGVDGGRPSGTVTRDSHGSLYGVTEYGGRGYGVLYKIDANGNETVLHSFSFTGADGRSPYDTVALDSAGNLYGTTSTGGAKGGGVVYKFGLAGSGTALYSFTGGADGNLPAAGVLVR